MKNFSGKFEIELGETTRELVCNFNLIIHLERNVFGRPLLQVLEELLEQKYYMHEMVSTFYAALKENKDTRLSYEEIGSEIMEKGQINYLAPYITMITYAATGQTPEDLEVEESPKTDKKK
jgi:hypothetical protein